MESILRINVTANAKRDSVTAGKKGKLSISVRAKAEDNAANRAVIALLANHFTIEEKNISIVTGHQSPNKTIRIRKR